MPSPSGADAEIAGAIEAAGGAVPFERFMELALYGEHGFYRTGGAAGRRGDFLTSPEVGPLFGAVLARAMDAWWREMGEPSDFTVVEAGAGRGTLARSLLAARPAALTAAEVTARRVLPTSADRVDFVPDPGSNSTHPDHDDRSRYVAVETSEAQRAEHPSTVTSLAAIPEGPITGVVVANELLDNLPFALLVYDGGWREAAVAVDRSGRFVEVLVEPTQPLPPALPPTAAHGARAPIQRRAAQWVSDVLERLSPGSRLVLFDYCTPLTADLAASPWRAWLRTYAGHERGGHYLSAPGTQDITAQVVVDQLPPPDAVRTQAHFLQRWGVADLVEEGRAAWAAAAGAPDLAAMKMRSRVREAEALLDPHGLGGFFVLEYQR